MKIRNGESDLIESWRIPSSSARFINPSATSHLEKHDKQITIEEWIG